MVVAYLSSPQWRDTKSSTATTYLHFIEYIRQEYAGLSVRGLKREHVIKIRDKVAMADRVKSPEHPDKKHLSGQSQANRLVSILRMLLKFGVDRGWRKDNPATDIPPIKVQSDGFPPWSEDEISTFESYWSVGTRERLAFDLLLYTAHRSGDVRRMTWKHVRGDAIAVRQEKTTAALVLPIHPRLKASLEVASRDHQVIVATNHGKGYSEGGFGNFIRKAARAAGVQDRSAHGLRKSAATRLADAGCTEVQIQAVTGHKTTKELAKYIEARNQRLLAEAAMAKI
ncbi:tyrosine-type recombinase/integrase [Brevundimonas sp. BH3]|uniref:tyrosine-type recombinase/integrase n=1 Tax=Brevundimonas sp. BH3 TaxID=3133089 RepID=UPI003253217A